jgi:hypothetical protein
MSQITVTHPTPRHFFTEAELQELLAGFHGYSFELDVTAHLCVTAIRS